MSFILTILNNPIYLFGILVLGILYFWYFSIIKRRNKVLEALSGIDVQLKNRSDLIPNILIIAKKFMDHEEKVFTEIVKLRESLAKPYNNLNSEEVKDYLQKSEQLSKNMTNLMIRSESYPDLKSNQNMLQAQQSYNEIEAQIAAARRFYNSSVINLRDSIQIFPGNILALLARVEKMPLFETDEASRKPIDASKYL